MFRAQLNNNFCFVSVIYYSAWPFLHYFAEHQFHSSTNFDILEACVGYHCCYSCSFVSFDYSYCIGCDKLKLVARDVYNGISKYSASTFELDVFVFLAPRNRVYVSSWQGNKATWKLLSFQAIAPRYFPSISLTVCHFTFPPKYVQHSFHQSHPYFGSFPGERFLLAACRLDKLIDSKPRLSVLLLLHRLDVLLLLSHHLDL